MDDGSRLDCWYASRQLIPHLAHGFLISRSEGTDHAAPWTRRKLRHQTLSVLLSAAKPQRIKNTWMNRKGMTPVKNWGVPRLVMAHRIIQEMRKEMDSISSIRPDVEDGRVSRLKPWSRPGVHFGTGHDNQKAKAFLFALPL